MLPINHRKITLENGSSHIGLPDPVRGKEGRLFCLGESVIECEKKQSAISLDGWKLLDECPFCRVPIGKGIGPTYPPSGPKPFKPGYPEGHRNSHDLKLVAIVVLALIACGMGLYIWLNIPVVGQIEVPPIPNGTLTLQPTTRVTATSQLTIGPSATPRLTIRPSATSRPTIRPSVTPRSTIESSPTSVVSVTVHCPGAFPTRLSIGDRARILNYQVNVRSGPGTRYSINNRLRPGRAVTILDGPECDDGQLWYYVISDEFVSGGRTIRVEGWVVEESGNHWFMEPID